MEGKEQNEMTASDKDAKTCEWCHSPRGMGHGKACAMWFLSELFCLLGLIALVAAWVTNYRGTTWLGVESDHLFHDAIAFLVLCVIFRMKKRDAKHAMMMKMMMGGCGGECGGGSCGGAGGGNCGQGGCGGDCAGSCGSGSGCGEGGCGKEGCGCK